MSSGRVSAAALREMLSGSGRTDGEIMPRTLLGLGMRPPGRLVSRADAERSHVRHGSGQHLVNHDVSGTVITAMVSAEPLVTAGHVWVTTASLTVMACWC
jgi:hypothetical protein